MHRRILSTGALLFTLFAPTAAQTAKDMKDKFGEAVGVYPVAEHIWMAPTFTVDGQLCEMRLFPKRISATTNYLGEDKLRPWELKDVLDKLVPPETRGNRTKFFGLSFLTGQASETTFAYENVTFTFLASLHFSVPDSNSMKPVPVQTENTDQRSNDGLPVPNNAEIAVISLGNRVCPKP